MLLNFEYNAPTRVAGSKTDNPCYFDQLQAPVITLSSPPAFLNSGKHPSHSELPSGHGFKTNDNLLLVFTCMANRASHLSMSIHRREAGIYSIGVAFGYLKVMEDRTGAERIQGRNSARRGEREPE